jgi:hypothetical protein
MIARKKVLSAALSIGLALAASSAFAGGAQKVEDALWGAGVTWDTVLTPTSFANPPLHSVDMLYDFSMSGLMGQRGVSSNVPGDGDYNGGRWWVQMVVFTEQGLEVHDPDGDGYVNFELQSAEAVQGHVDLGHIEVYATSTYFVCPLIKSN